MAFRRAFSTTNKWRKFLQQSRGVHSEPVQPTIILGPNKKAFFNVGIFLLGGGIAGTMYYYVLQPNKFNGEILERNANYVEESEPLSKFNEKIDSYRWGSTAKPETEVQISKKEIILDEKTIKSHLSAIGFDEFDVDLILHEKKLKNQKLKISEILDELIEKYKKSGVKISKDGDNKKIEIKKQKTMIIEKINEDSGEYKFSNRVNKKHEESNLIFGKEEKEVKLITHLEVQSTIVDKMKQEQTVHAIYTSLFALYAGLACTFAFKRRCRLRYDIFLSPIEKSRYDRYCRVFGATVGSVSKGAVYTVPWFALLCITTGRPFEPQSYEYEKYYRDGYMELLPPAPVSLYPSSPNPLRINICNSKLNYFKDTDDVMECTTTLSTIQTESHPSFHPLEYPRNPLAPFGTVFFCTFAFAIAFPFTILPASCVGGFVLATLLMF